jgi:hypothetical protein
MVAELNELTIQDLRNVSLGQLLKEAKSKDCFDYNSLFIAKAREGGYACDEKTLGVYRLLIDITSLHLRPDNYKEPFGAMVVMSGKRSAILEDFSDSQIAVLKELVLEIEDSEFRARVSDAVWLRTRDYKMAAIAIDSYLESATALEDPNHWTRCVDRIQRAFRLAASLGDATGKLAHVVHHIEMVLEKYQGEDPLYLSEKLMALLCERKLGDPAKYGRLAEKMAKKAEENHDWPRAQTYWQRKAEWERIAKDEDNRKLSLAQAAETYVKIADAMVKGDKPSYMAASSQMSRAIEAYRRIGGMGERIKELHSILLDYEQKSLQEFGVISSPAVDLTEAIEGARASVRGKELIEALFILSQGLRIEAVEALRKRVQEHVKQFPFTYLTSGIIVNEKGKVIGKRPALLAREEGAEDEALRPHLFHEVKIGYSIDVQAVIDPMRRLIDLEHYATVDDFAPVVLNNPLIPQHREWFYAKGLLTGLQGDFLTAIHLLVPQFENSLRYLLEQRGVPTSGMDHEGIQEEYDLNKLLYLDQTKAIFGEDLIFHLQGLLVEREGSNIRNRLAHGLMYPGDFYSPECVYLWAVILRLCCWPLMVKMHETQKQRDEVANTGPR